MVEFLFISLGVLEVFLIFGMFYYGVYGLTKFCIKKVSEFVKEVKTPSIILKKKTKITPNKFLVILVLFVIIAMIEL